MTQEEIILEVQNNRLQCTKGDIECDTLVDIAREINSNLNDMSTCSEDEKQLKENNKVPMTLESTGYSYSGISDVINNMGSDEEKELKALEV